MAMEKLLHERYDPSHLDSRAALDWLRRTNHTAARQGSAISKELLQRRTSRYVGPFLNLSEHTQKMRVILEAEMEDMIIEGSESNPNVSNSP